MSSIGKRKGGNKVEFVSDFGQKYRLPVLPGDSCLVDPFLERLLLQLTRSKVQAMEPDTLVFGPAKLLFHLVITREYLERKPEDDAEICRIVIGEKGVDEESGELVYKQQYRIRRHPTIPEYVLAAMEGISESEDDITDIVPLVTVCKISNDLELRWTHGTLAYVETLDEDKAEYVWSQSRIAGMTSRIRKQTVAKSQDQLTSRRTVKPKAPTRKPTAAQKGVQAPSKAKETQRKADSKPVAVNNDAESTANQLRRSSRIQQLGVSRK